MTSDNIRPVNQTVSPSSVTWIGLAMSGSS